MAPPATATAGGAVGVRSTFNPFTTAFPRTRRRCANACQREISNVASARSTRIPAFCARKLCTSANPGRMLRRSTSSFNPGRLAAIPRTAQRWTAGTSAVVRIRAANAAVIPNPASQNRIVFTFEARFQNSNRAASLRLPYGSISALTAKHAKRGFAGDGKKLVAGVADPGLAAEALAKAEPASARPATTQALLLRNRTPDRGAKLPATRIVHAGNGLVALTVSGRRDEGSSALGWSTTEACCVHGIVETRRPRRAHPSKTRRGHRVSIKKAGHERTNSSAWPIDCCMVASAT